DEVLSRAGRDRVVHPKCDESDAPSPLDVKEVHVEGRRYIVCRNQDEARKDGKWVLRTNTELDAAEVAIQYKRLWMVEAWFRSCKSLLGTRPIYHRCDATIVGH